MSRVRIPSLTPSKPQVSGPIRNNVGAADLGSVRFWELIGSEPPQSVVPNGPELYSTVAIFGGRAGLFAWHLRRCSGSGTSSRGFPRMSLEDKLSGWTGPSSETEQDKQERTERMIREAVDAHPGFKGCSLSVHTKGSYANKTNVRTDSDVDVAVQCHEAKYWDGRRNVPEHSPYRGVWTPSKLRDELQSALEAKFPGQVDAKSSTAFRINSGTARVDADVVPCFDFTYYFPNGDSHEGVMIIKKDGTKLQNYPKQQIENGKAKNNRTSKYYKKSVRIMKRVENSMVTAGVHREVPSFFVECLVYNCPDEIFLKSTWTETVSGIIIHVWNGLKGAEPSSDVDRWREVNECKWLFSTTQDWTREDGRDFAKAAWNYLGLT